LAHKLLLPKKSNVHSKIYIDKALPLLSFVALTNIVFMGTFQRRLHPPLVSDPVCIAFLDK